MRSISDVAFSIMTDWRKPYFGAVPYLNAMMTLDKPTDMYGLDSAKDIVLYFLSNANTYRGENARAYKSELRKIVGLK